MREAERMAFREVKKKGLSGGKGVKKFNMLILITTSFEILELLLVIAILESCSGFVHTKYYFLPL